MENTRLYFIITLYY